MKYVQLLNTFNNNIYALIFKKHSNLIHMHVNMKHNYVLMTLMGLCNTSN